MKTVTESENVKLSASRIRYGIPSPAAAFRNRAGKSDKSRKSNPDHSQSYPRPERDRTAGKPSGIARESG